MNKIIRVITKNKRTLLAIGSYVLGFFSFAKIWRSRHEIDAVLDDTKERRKSEDKKVRRAARLETFKRLVPILSIPVLSIIGSVFLGVSAHNVASAEIADAHRATDAVIRGVINDQARRDNTFVDIDNENLKAEAILASNPRKNYNPDDPIETFRFMPTGEILFFPRSWRFKGLDKINDDIERILENKREVNLGELRELLGKTGPTYLDEVVTWKWHSYHDTIPSLKYEVPREKYNNSLMWELRVDGVPNIDEDAFIDY